MYVLSGFSCFSLLLLLMNLGHVWSHGAWMCDLQLTHQYLSCLPLVQSAVWCSLPQVPQMEGWSHSTARWLDPMVWHLRHLLGSFFILLAHTRLPAIIRLSLMAWFAALGDHNLAMRWAVHFPIVLLVVGLIHLVDSIDSGGSPISGLIFLISPSASGL